MKKTTLLVISACAAANAAVMSMHDTYDGAVAYGGGGGIYDRMPDAVVTTNYIETSQLFSSPESVYELGQEWKLAPDATLLRLSTNAVAWAAGSATNETDTANLRGTFEFLLSPMSVAPRTSDLRVQKFNLLANGHIAMSGGLPAEDWLESFSESHPVNTNTVVGIAKTMALVQTRRYLRPFVDDFYPPSHPKYGERTITNYTYTTRSERDRNEGRALEPFMGEVLAAERHVFNMLKTALSSLRDDNAEGLSDLVNRVAQIADISEKGLLMLREAAGLNPDGSEKENNGTSE